MAVLPDVPKVVLDVVADRSHESQGFLALKRFDLAVVEGETRSRSFAYDMIDRRALDAAVMVAHYVDGAQRRRVFLRSAVRPPVGLRARLGASPANAVLWEVPAGLIEPGEPPGEAAARELEEELGFAVGADRMKPLGPSTYPAPGFVGEAHFYFHVQVDPSHRKDPPGDGSPLEEAARIVDVPLDDALEACRTGEITDAKTELALRRLAEIL